MSKPTGLQTVSRWSGPDDGGREEGELGTVRRGGQSFERWQHKPTHTTHPNETK